VWLLLLVVYILLLTPSSQAQTLCTSYTASDGVTKYNLAPLTKSADYTGNEVTEAGINTYFWQFCAPIKSTYGCNTDNVQNAGAVQTTAGVCYVIGYVPEKISDHPRGLKQGVMITYTNNIDTQCAGGEIRTSYFLLTCDPNKEFQLDKITEPGLCKYQFDISTKHACPAGSTSGTGTGGNGGKGGEGGGLSGGSVFLIAFFVMLALYFSVGAVVKWKVYSASGVEMIPNTDFWVDLPGLIRDGCIFVKNKITGSVGYSSL